MWKLCGNTPKNISINFKIPKEPQTLILEFGRKNHIVIGDLKCIWYVRFYFWPLIMEGHANKIKGATPTPLSDYS
jgi:hypothetical protein